MAFVAPFSRPPAEPRIHRRWAFWIAVAFGSLLRTCGLFSQVLIGDEAHAFRAALRMDLAEALVSYPFTANSPPFNAWLRLLIDLGISPSELALRVPVWLTGIALLVLVPLWVGRRVGSSIGCVTAWLLAVSPILVFYTRFMRPYAPYVLLSVVAAALFFDWVHRPRRWTGLAYAAVAAAAAYLHLLAAPLVVAPFGWLLLERVLGGDSPARRPAWSKIFGLAATTAGAMALFVVPAWPNLQKLASSRRLPLEANSKDLLDALFVLAGSGSLFVVLTLWLLAVAGGVVLSRRSPALARLLAVFVSTQIVAVPVLSPTFIGSPLILARYVLPVIVPALICVAVALTAWRPGRFASVPAAIAVAGLFLTGPLDDLRLYGHSLDWRPELVAVHPTKEPRPVWEVAAVYGRLTGPASEGLVELPVRATSRFVNVLADYQRGHGRRVWVSPGDNFLSDPRLDLASIVPDDPDELLASDARWLVVHRDWAAEFGPGLGFQSSVNAEARRRARGVLERSTQHSGRKLREFERLWGTPDLEDETHAVWDLARLRSGAAGR